MKRFSALGATILSLVTLSGTALADGRRSVPPVSNNLYKQNCAECHFAYQPGLLPARSWQKLMLSSSLENHFGENAEMQESDRIAILNYLVSNAGDTNAASRSFKLFRHLEDNETPLRITDLPYIRHEHDEVPKRMIRDNKDVRSISNCNACHTQAATGNFSEHSIRIPNFGAWDD